MIHESEIPEYALQPAKGPEIVSAKGIYSEEKIYCPSGMAETVYQFEEDVLVPDVKPDMAEILMLDCGCTVMPKDREIIPKTDDFLNLTGDLILQVLYKPADSDDLVAIKTKIPYKYQWKLNPSKTCNCDFNCDIKEISYTIVNERKFRVKTTLAFTGDFYSDIEYKIFEGIENDKLEIKEDKVSFTSLGAVKNDTVEIDECFTSNERDISPEVILKQNFVITENYRQVATDKIVINGFIYCNFLYSGIDRGGEEELKVYKHQSQRLEFTQFIPINKEERGHKWNFSKVDFSTSNMEVSISVSEEKEYNFRVKGSVESKVQIYEAMQKNIITDAYHCDKNFTCTFRKRKIFNLVAVGNTETSVREILTLGKDDKVRCVIFSDGRIRKNSCNCEKARANIEGLIDCDVIWQDREGKPHNHVVTMPFRGTCESGEIEETHISRCKCLVKNMWCELINENQIEINGQIYIGCEVTSEQIIATPENPGFVCETRESKKYPMTVAMACGKETTWDIAKKYKTTCEQIVAVNGLEHEPEEGRKLLIVR